MFKRWWKYSRWRFYWLNFKWNYGFWLGCRKIFKQIKYTKVNDKEFSVDPYGHMRYKPEQVVTKRFEGFMYKGMIVDDNPGFSKIDRETWSKWKKKGLIKL